MNQDTLLQLVKYDPDTGIFTRHKSGKVAKGYVNDGYLIISVQGKQYRAHRLAFLYMTGDYPPVVDHINRDRLCNKWSNLRAVTRLGNAQMHHLERILRQGIVVYPTGNHEVVGGLTYKQIRNKYI